MAELLLELRSEEIPARMQARAAEDLQRLVTEKLKAAKLEFAAAAAYATPRRLALVVKGLPRRQPDTVEERKGPKVGAPQQAIDGFLKAAGLKDLAEAEVRDTDKGKVYMAVRKIAGRDTSEVLPGILEGAIRDLSWPKSMRWSDGTFKWVRPLHNVMCKFGSKSLHINLSPTSIGKAGPLNLIPPLSTIRGTDAPIGFKDATIGNILAAPQQEFWPEDFAEYRKLLEANYVMLDPEKRKRAILEQAEALAAEAGLRFRHDPGLLDEVSRLVEWPVVLLGAFDEAFLAIPPEILVTSMRSHQKYFALEQPDGGLANRFLVVANVPAPDGGERRANIVTGNERVLRARLADAKFFWDQDRKTPLSQRVPQLKDIVFHAKLGTLDQRIDRMEALAVALCQWIPEADRDQVRAAARLAKADLVTGVVGEFPELQGIMGRYYALADGEPAAVADAIAEHYAPRGPDDRCPSAPVSVAAALAEKLDTLIGFWAIDEKPTGSKDPFALRRAALGVIRLIVENRLRLPMLQVLDIAKLNFVDLVADSIVADLEGRGGREEIRFDLLAFFADRMKVALREKGVRHDLIAACFALGEDDLVRLLARVEALSAFLKSEDGANLLTAYKRAANIVRIEGKKDGKDIEGAPDRQLFVQHEEQALWMALDATVALMKTKLEHEDFKGAMCALAALRTPVDEFFDRILVNAEDKKLRANRLRLLQAIRGTMDRVAKFELVEG